MSEPRQRPRMMSAGVILVDTRGQVLLQHRDDNPKIMFPGHWGITGGAAHRGETPEQTARREVTEETGLTLGTIEPFRAYYFTEGVTPQGGRRAPSKTRSDYELYLFHAPCDTPAEEMICGEGRELRFWAPDDIGELDIAYNHRDVLGDFVASPLYARYLQGTHGANGAEEGDPVDPVALFLAALDAGDDWFDALMQAIALWERPEETVGGRRFRYLIGGEAFDWLLLAERLIEAAQEHQSCSGGSVAPGEAERLLFEGRPPPADGESLSQTPPRMSDEMLRDRIGEAKHRAHLNYVYGVTVEEALQYAVELDVSKERVTVHIKDRRVDGAQVDPVYERIYGRPRTELLREFRESLGNRHSEHIALSELREFMYWLFKYRVANQEPARVASDTRKALACLSAMEASARTRRSGASTPAGAVAEP